MVTAAGLYIHLPVTPLRNTLSIQIADADTEDKRQVIRRRRFSPARLYLDR